MCVCERERERERELLERYRGGGRRLMEDGGKREEDKARTNVGGIAAVAL